MIPQKPSMYGGLALSHKQNVCLDARQEEQQAGCNGPDRSAPGRVSEPHGQGPSLCQALASLGGQSEQEHSCECLPPSLSVLA